MKKFLLFYLCLLVCFATQAIAQSRTVTGTVTAKEDGLPIPGVSVRVKGTTTGTPTDVNGKFSLDVASDATLVFSFIGYTTVEVPVSGRSTIQVALSASSSQLGEVVVTGALGITRTRNQQAYAAQEVTGEEVNKTRGANFVDGLQGKVAGLEIRQNNGLGASTNVVLRGYKSIYGNNQALFVIDGVPIDNTLGNAKDIENSKDQAVGGGGYDYGSPISDINPDDIESVTVLKGAGATALYGSRGSNGVILITTKKVRKGLGITVNSSLKLSEIDKSTFPKYQDQYGAGYGQFYNDDSGYFFTFDVNGDGTPDLVTPTTEDASFGAKFDPNLLVYQWDAFDTTSPNYKKATPWVAAKNGPITFFRKPLSTNQSIFITNGSDNGTFKLGYTKNVDNGIMPNQQINKNMFDLGGTYNITPKLTVGGSINFTNTAGIGRMGTGYDGTLSDARNVMTNFREWWETNVDVQDLKAAYDRTKANATWNYADPENNKLNAIFWNNPYYVAEHNYETDLRNRYLGNVNFSYKPTSWLSITGRTSLDSYSQFNQERYDLSSIGVAYYTRQNNNYSETNYDLLANVDKDISPDFNFKAVLGTNIRRTYTSTVTSTTNGGLALPNFFALSNSKNALNAPEEYQALREVNGVFAEAALTWRKMLTLDATIRRDQSSTLPAANNTYYYPSVSGGFVFSELLKDYTWLSYGKLRASWASVGADAPLYSIVDTYLIKPAINGVAQSRVDPSKNNPDLKPELTHSSEVGLELAFFKSRLGLDVTYYNTNTFNEILPVNVSTATGYDYRYLNAGSIRNRGIEISLNGTPLVTNDFTWKATVNFTRARSKVTSLFKNENGEEAKNLVLGSFQSGETLNAPLGEAFSIIRGTDYVYDSKGNKVVGANGQYLITATSNNDIGNTNPSWTGSINNSFTYKNFNLSFLIDVREGGDVFSSDMSYGLATGLYPETAYTNDLGNPVRNTIANGGGFIRPGVTETGAPNTKRVSAVDYSAFGYYRLPMKAFVYDASFVKLREALIGYTLPQSTLGKLGPIKEVTFQLIGTNLWIIHKNLPYSDPEDNVSAGNLQGIQAGAMPVTRTFSLNLKLRF